MVSVQMFDKIKSANNIGIKTSSEFICIFNVLLNTYRVIYFSGKFYLIIFSIVF